MVVPYDPLWAMAFEKIKNELTPVLGATVLAIEHVGSTAVPGLYAKPIIDIDIVIEHGVFDRVTERLREAGYTHVGNQGIEGREAFKYEDKPHLMKHHLYVCEKDAAELKRHLALRDYLRQHKGSRDQYSHIKRVMAEKYPHDIDQYIKGKEPVILEIYKKAGLSVN